MIKDVHPGSGSWFFYPSWIPDPQRWCRGSIISTEPVQLPHIILSRVPIFSKLKLFDTQAVIPQKMPDRELGGFPLLIIDTLLTEPTDLAFLQLVQHFARLSCRQNMEREDASCKQTWNLLHSSNKYRYVTSYPGIWRVGVVSVPVPYLFPDMKFYEGFNPFQEPTADPTPELKL